MKATEFSVCRCRVEEGTAVLSMNYVPGMPLQSPDVRLARRVPEGQVPAGLYGGCVCTCVSVLVSVEVKAQSLGVFYFFCPTFFLDLVSH